MNGTKWAVTLYSCSIYTLRLVICTLHMLLTINIYSGVTMHVVTANTSPLHSQFV